MIKLGISRTLTAFSDRTIGTKVLSTYTREFMNCVRDAVGITDFENAHTKGQAFIRLPEIANSYVSSGVGNPTQNPEDYVIRNYRGQVGLYLKRHRACKVRDVSVVVYTKEAFLSDPDINEIAGEREEVLSSGYTHIICAVLTNSQDKATYSYPRFVKNLAGANNDFSPDKVTVDFIIKTAKKVVESNKRFMTVAD